MYHLWDCFSLELETSVSAKGLGDADPTKEQFIERVRSLGVSTPAHQHISTSARQHVSTLVAERAASKTLAARETEAKKVKTEEVLVPATYETAPHAECKITKPDKETAEFSTPKKPSFVEAHTLVNRKPSGRPQEALGKPSGAAVLRPQEALLHPGTLTGQQEALMKPPESSRKPREAIRKPSGAAVLHPQEALLCRGTHTGH